MVSSRYAYVLSPPPVGKAWSGTFTNMDKVWQELSDLCKAYPNLWFVIPDTQVSFSHAIRNGKPARYFGPAGTFQATVRETYHGPTNTMMGVMYVRYIG